MLGNVEDLQPAGAPPVNNQPQWATRSLLRYLPTTNAASGPALVMMGALAGIGGIAGMFGADSDAQWRGAAWGAGAGILWMFAAERIQQALLPDIQRSRAAWVWWVGPPVVAGYFAGKKGTES